MRIQTSAVRLIFASVAFALACSCSVAIRALQIPSTVQVAQLEAAGATAVVAGVCSGAITITREDSGGLPLSLGTETAVALAGIGSGQFYSDSGCSAPITSATIPAGAAAVTVYAKDTVAETLSLGFTASAAGAGTQSLTVDADVPVALTLSATSTVAANACMAVTVSRKDQYGNLAAPASSTAVTLSGVGKGHFYTSNTCASTTTTATIASSASAAVVYFRNSYVEPSLTLATAGLTSNGTLALAVTGPFAQPVTIANATSGFPAGGTTYRLTTADFDGDGHADFATTYSFSGNQVYVAWGDGTGSVTAGPTLAVGSSPGGVTALSLRGNGKYDIVTANYGAAANSANLSVILGNGDRTFAAAVNYNSGASLRYTNEIAGGVNLLSTTGKTDLVVTYYGDSGTRVGAGVEVFPGNGDGTLGTPVSYATDGQGNSGPSVGDMNHDGLLDFVVPLYTGGGANASVYLNQGGGGGFSVSSYNPGAPNYGNVWTFGNFNGDGIADWLLGLRYYGLFASVGDGTTATQPPAINDTAMNDVNYNRALSGVFTTSGHADAVYLGSAAGLDHNAVILYPGNGDGTFGSHLFYNFPAATADVVSGDFNGDTKQDLMVLTTDGVLHFLAGQ